MVAPSPICVAGHSDAIAGSCFAAPGYFFSEGEWHSSPIDTGTELNNIGIKSSIIFYITEPETSYTDESDVSHDVSTSVKIQTRTADTQSKLELAEWGANNGSGVFSTSSYYNDGDIIVSSPTASGKRWLQARVVFATDDGKYSPSMNYLAMKNLSEILEDIDITEYVKPMDDIELVVDGEKIFSGSLEEVSPDYALEEKVSMSGYGAVSELQFRIVKWQYEDYAHNIARDLINRYNQGGLISIERYYGTNAEFQNGSTTVTITGLDLTSIDNPSWIRLKQSTTAYKWYKIDSIVNSGELELASSYDGNQTSDANFIIDDFDCDDFTTTGLIFAQYTNETIAEALSYLVPLCIGMFWVDKDYKLHFKKDNVVDNVDHTYFKDFNIKVLQLKEESRDLRNRGFLYGGSFTDNFEVTAFDGTTITDSSKSYHTNVFKGYTITVLYDESGGDEAGTVYPILSNTSDTLEIGTHGLAVGDYVAVKGRVFEVLQNMKSINETGKIREFIINDSSITNPAYGRFVLLKMADQYLEPRKEGLLELPFGDLDVSLGDVVDLRGFVGREDDVKTYWDNFNWDEANWSTETQSFFRFHLAKFTHTFERKGVYTSIEISKTQPTLEDMFRDFDARIRNSEQVSEDIPAYQFMADFIPPLNDNKPAGTALTGTHTRGLILTSSVNGVIRWE